MTTAVGTHNNGDGAWSELNENVDEALNAEEQEQPLLPWSHRDTDKAERPLLSSAKFRDERPVVLSSTSTPKKSRGWRSWLTAPVRRVLGSPVARFLSRRVVPRSIKRGVARIANARSNRKDELSKKPQGLQAV